ncbi:MAG TPA: hypothetical protein VMH23_07470 [Bacteroidota bacterium]|nr:hypothetical protein [Bacteroidota bacterium]
MDISRVTGSGLPLEPLKSKKDKHEPEKAAQTKDTAEISDEAMSLFKSTEKRAEDIRNRIDSGFYLQRDVSEKIVDAMMNDLKSL